MTAMPSVNPSLPEPDMTTTPPSLVPAAGSRFRWMRLLLVVSLGLNLLVAGLLLGDALTGGGPGRGPRPVEMTLGPFARALDEGDRRAILEDLRGHPDLRPLTREEFAAGLQGIREVVQADPFESAAVLQALSEQSERINRSERAVQEALVEHLAAMSPEARKAFADRLGAAR